MDATPSNTPILLLQELDLDRRGTNAQPEEGSWIANPLAELHPPSVHAFAAPRGEEKVSPTLPLLPSRPPGMRPRKPLDPQSPESAPTPPSILSNEPYLLSGQEDAFTPLPEAFYAAPTAPAPMRTTSRFSVPFVAPKPAPEPSPNPREVDDVPVRATPAGIARRAIAWAIDSLLVGGIGILILQIANRLVVKKDLSSWTAVEEIALPVALLIGLLWLAYSAVVAVAFRSRCFGRRLMGIHLVDSRGNPPGVLRALSRSALIMVSIVPFLGGLWLALFDRRGQTLHDKLTQTFMVRLKT